MSILTLQVPLIHTSGNRIAESALREKYTGWNMSSLQATSKAALRQSESMIGAKEDQGDEEL